MTHINSILRITFPKYNDSQKIATFLEYHNS